MKKLLMVMAIASMAFLASCDDGLIYETVHTEADASYSVNFRGVVKELDSWQGNYSVVIAGFGDGSDYSLIQKVIPVPKDDNAEMNISLDNVPAETKTIEIAVVNQLRARVVTLFSYAIPDNQDVSAVITVDAGEVDASMFAAIQRGVFDDKVLSCSQCHGAVNPRAGLCLAEGRSYDALVNVRATHDAEKIRVIPGNSADSYLYQVITDGGGINYNHPALFADDDKARLVGLVKSWIDNEKR